MEKLKPIKLVAMDVDGVLTDGSMIIGAGGDIKMFNVLDGLGINLALTIGLEIAWITGNISAAVSERAKSIGVKELHQGSRFKSTVLKEIASRRGFDFAEIAYVGDDLNDLPAIQIAGASFAVQNAVQDVKDAVDFVTKASGGRGAVREVIETILKAQDRWDESVAAFLRKLEAEREEGRAPGQVA